MKANGDESPANPTVVPPEAGTIPPVRVPGKSESTERQWRDLAGGGHTALSASSAARVRETRPLDNDEVEQAHRDVVIQRRHWTPGPPTTP